MGETAIEWTDETWNPVTGCDKVSPGCAHCYAEAFAERFRGVPGHAYEQGFDLKLWPKRLGKPWTWKKPRMVFVNSMSDLFHEDVPDQFIAQVLTTILFTGDKLGHTFQILTKRPERARDAIRAYYSDGGLDGTGNPALRSSGVGREDRATGTWVMPWLWVGVSIENRRFVGRADILREIPAAVRFISAEPLLGPLVCPDCKGGGSVEPWGGHPGGAACPRGCADGGSASGPEVFGPSLDLTGIDWLIAGGESGKGRRPMNLDWARDLRDACERQYPGPCLACRTWSTPAHGREGHCTVCMGPGTYALGGLGRTAFFLKQLGGPANAKRGGAQAVLDGRLHTEMPTHRSQHAA